jgi:uncharacterized protein YbbC (DUF1343 family)
VASFASESKSHRHLRATIVAVRRDRHGLASVVLLVISACGGGDAPPRSTPPPLAPSAREEPPSQIAPLSPAPPAVAPLVRVALEHDHAIDRAVQAALDRRAMPGAVVVIGRSDGTIFRRAYGARAIDPEREPMSEDTIFDLASVTKVAATTLAAMWLVERGVIELDAPAVRYVPEIADARITIRQLLTHTSGLRAVDLLSEYEGGREASFARMFALRPERAPGRYVYSDVGFIVLGAVLERASGRPLDRLLHEEIYAPLGMNDTGFAPQADLRARVAPTERAERRGGVIIRGEVHDPRAYRLGGIAGNAGLFSSADDLARLARMLLREGELEGARVLSPETVRAMVGGERALGWERGHGSLSERAYGHGGFTGTALWIDPEHDVFLVFLSNRVHPNGRGDVKPLIRELAGIAREAAADVAPRPRVEVLTGIDVLRRDGFRQLVGRRAVLLTNDAARARDGARTLDLLASAPGVTLVRVLAPEHGLSASREGRIASSTDERTGLPVASLFGATRDPTPAMFEDADIVVVDLQDVGARFYTYGATLSRVLAAASARGLPVLVLDRPEPNGGRASGPVCEDELRSFVNHHALPIVHGMTMGELAAFLSAERSLSAALEVVPLEGWRRGMRFADTGLRWTPPSPNLRTPDEVQLYPALALVEGTNVSVGRGTDTPFEVVGAPWMDPEAVIAEIGALPGVRSTPAEFVPMAARYTGRTCRGVRFELTDREAFDPVRTGLAIARALARVHGERWDAEAALPMIGDREVHRAIVEGRSVDEALRSSEARLREFEERRAPHLRY